MVGERQRPGALEVICGPMFSGKSEELIRRLRRVRIAKQRLQAFKPALDDRYDAVAIASHAESRFEALPVADSAELARMLDPEVEVVAIDEVQFFDEGLMALAESLADRGLRVILAGLDLDSEGRPFGIMPQVLARAEYVLKLHAICTVCGAAASRTYRKVRSGGQVLVGAADLYEARCRHCHQEIQAEPGVLPGEAMAPEKP